MLTALIVRLVDFCRRFALGVVLAILLAGAGLAFFVVGHFKMDTNVDRLLAEDLPWRKAEQELAKAFPQTLDRLVIVIEAGNGDAAEWAAQALTAEMEKRPDLFKTVVRPENIPYFRKNGILLLSESSIENILSTLVQAQPFLGSLAHDPSLRGLFGTMGLTVEGIKVGEARYEDLILSFKTLAQLLDRVLDGQEPQMPWHSMMASQPESLRDLRKYILVQPVMDFSDLSPGAKATKAVRQMIEDLHFNVDHDIASVRLTGTVALNDEEFASVADGMEASLFVSLLLVAALLFAALRSARLIVPILLTLGVGLIATTAFALAALGSLNLISVAFAVMFVGIAVDFGIQFGVRFRDAHHSEPDAAAALRATARSVARPLALAAMATAAGFLAFLPTDYRGVSELGLIAGAGMVIAFLLNISFLPALLTLFKPPAEPEEIGFAPARRVDAFLASHRKGVLTLALLLAVGAGFVARQTRFDFDPLNLKDPKTESVRAMFDVMKDPDSSAYALSLLAPDLNAAKALAASLEELPEVDHTITLASFVPLNQETKLALIDDAKMLLDPSLNPPAPLPPPTTQETLEALKDASARLRSLGPDKTEASALADALDKVVARGSGDLIARLDKAMIQGMTRHLARVRDMLSATPVTEDTISSDLKRDWIAQDGRAKIEIYPKGDMRDQAEMKAFADAVRKIAPDATGAPLSILESGSTIVGAFIKAGLLGLAAIALLAFAVLRRVSDVIRLLLPLLLAGVLTLATMVILSLPLNFANIIGLPLLMSLGVSFAVYFVTYWRDGKDNPLSSSMARAVLFSASTTLVAFGSLSQSSHPGTRGMGELLTIALIYSVLCTFLVLPALLGRSSSAKP